MTVVRIALCAVALALVVATSMTRAAECPYLPPPYAGPIFDADVQAWNPDVDGLVAAARANGVQRVALYANSPPRPIGAETAAAVRALAQAEPDLVVLGAPKIGFIHGDLPRGYVAATVAGVREGSYRFVGEILYTHGDKPDHPPQRGGEVVVDPLAAGTKDLLTRLAPYDVPLLTHWEAYAFDRDQARFDRLYDAWPKQRFVIPSLIYGSPASTDAILGAHPNVWGIISRLVDGRYQFVDPAKAAKLGPSMFDSCGVLLPAWRDIMTKYAARLMYGSDFYANGPRTWRGYGDPIRRYRAIAGQLPPDVAARISWENAAAFFRTTP